VQQGRENGAGHHVADGLIGETCGISLAVSGKAGAIGIVLVRGLVDSSEQARDGKFVGVERAARRDFEFLPYGERRKLGASLDGGEVGHDAEDAVVFLAGGIRDGAGRASVVAAGGGWLRSAGTATGDFRSGGS